MIGQAKLVIPQISLFNKIQAENSLIIPC